MSDENEGPPPLSPQLHEFFEEHAKTGEPTQAELGRALLRLHGATRPTRFSMAGRRLLPPEVLAVAAVLVLSVGGAFIGWRVRSANTQTAALSAAKAAWVRGDLEAASAAFEACSTAECARLAAAVKRAKVQSEHLDALDEAESGSLLALDRELSDGARSVLAERLEQKPVESAEAFATKQISALLKEGRAQTTVNAAVEAFIRGAAVGTPPEEARRAFELVVSLVPATRLSRAAEAQLATLPAPEPVAMPVVESPYPPEVRALLDEAKAAKKERRYDDAIRLMTQCLNQFRDQPDCVVVQASVFAMRGTDTNSEADNSRAKAMYERFLRVADPDDKRLSRVREIVSSTTRPVLNDAVSCDSRWRRAVQQDLMTLARAVANTTSDPLFLLFDKDEERVIQLIDSEETRTPAGCAKADRAVDMLLKTYGERLEALVPPPGGPKKAPAQLYLSGYQLKDSDPDGARALFAQVIELAPKSTEAQKARSRLAELNASPGQEKSAGPQNGWGRLKIASNPSGADVILDGKRTGRRTPVLPSEALEVPVGRHTIQFKLNGKLSAPQTIDVVEGVNPVIRGDIPQ